MTRQEYLMDRYEDALFSLMMDKVATQEGEKALLEKERLQEEPESIIPETLHRKCLKTISHYYAKKNAKATRKTVSNIISKIAIIALIGVLTFTIAFASSPTFRANTLNFVMETFDDHTEFHFAEETFQSSSDLDMTVNWIPDGFSIISESSEPGYKSIVVGNGINKQATVILRFNKSAINLDSENADAKKIYIGETPAILFQNERSSQIIWQVDTSSAFVQICGENMDLDELIHIANDLTIK